MELEQIKKTIENIPDPEIPVLTIGDLGIVRKVYKQNSKIVVDLSPTYSGCPATKLISDMVAEKLTGLGIDKYSINKVISPTWSSTWISKEGLKKLESYGIAPPN